MPTPAQTWRRLPWLLLIPSALLAAACADVARPQGWAGPVQVEDALIVSVDRGKLASLDPADFSLNWLFPPDTSEGKRFKPEAIYGAPLVAAGRVYFGGYNGDVYALDAATGDLVWAQPFEASGPIIGALAADVRGEGQEQVIRTLFVGSDDGTLYALDPEGGSVKGTFDAGDSIWAAPLVAGNKLYVAAVNGKLFALDVESLEPVWDKPFKADAGLITDPVLADETTLLVGGIDRRLYAVDTTSGQEKWSFEADNWFWGRPRVVAEAPPAPGATVYAPNLDKHVYALDLASGQPVWAAPFEAEAPLRSSPILIGEVLIAIDRTGNVYGLDPSTGGLKWGPQILGKTVLSDPLALEDSVLIVAQGGDLFRIDPAGGLSTLLEVRRP